MAERGIAARFPTCPSCGGGIWPDGHTCPDAPEPSASDVVARGGRGSMDGSADDYDVEAFEDGKRAGYLLGRQAAQVEAQRLLVALVRAAGGRVKVPESMLVDDTAWVLETWHDPAQRLRIYRLAGPMSVTPGKVTRDE